MVPLSISEVQNSVEARVCHCEGGKLRVDDLVVELSLDSNLEGAVRDEWVPHGRCAFKVDRRLVQEVNDRVNFWEEKFIVWTIDDAVRLKSAALCWVSSWLVREELIVVKQRLHHVILSPNRWIKCHLAAVRAPVELNSEELTAIECRVAPVHTLCIKFPPDRVTLPDRVRPDEQNARS